MTIEEELDEIERQFRIQSIIDAPGVILLGIGLHTKFNANGEPFHPYLENPGVANSMLLIGGLIVGWSSIKLFKLARRKKQLENQGAM